MSESYQEHIYKGSLEEVEARMVKYCLVNNINNQEFSVAYQIALGIPINELSNSDKPIREEVFQLAKIIDEEIGKGYPLNRIPELIKGKGKL